jgi:hypothetical protein
VFYPFYIKIIIANTVSNVNYELSIINFTENYYFNGNDFFDFNKFEFCALFPKVQKEIIVIIGPGTGKILLSMD